MERGEKMYGFSDVSMRRRNVEFLLSRLHPAQIVMDLGCNQGHISALIADKVRRVVGVDHDQRALEKARLQYARPNIEFLHDDALNVLNGSERFDVVVLSHIIEHLDDPELFLKRLAPHTKWIYIEVPDLDASYLNHYRVILGANYQYTDNDHIWEFDRDALQELITSCGLKVLDAEHRYGLLKYWCASSQ